MCDISLLCQGLGEHILRFFSVGMPQNRVETATEKVPQRFKAQIPFKDNQALSGLKWGKKDPGLHGQQVGSEVRFSILYAHFSSNIFSSRLNR